MFNEMLLCGDEQLLFSVVVTFLYQTEQLML